MVLLLASWIDLRITTGIRSIVPFLGTEAFLGVLFPLCLEYYYYYFFFFLTLTFVRLRWSQV